MAQILSGTETAKALNEQLKGQCAALKALKRAPKLVIVRVGENPSDLSYERGALKRAEEIGVETERIMFPETVSKEELTAKLRELNGDEDTDGVLLFRPLPVALKACEREICNTLIPEKDVDCMTDSSQAAVYLGQQTGFPPCTPEACIRILDHYGIDVKGMKTTVIGRSLVVGKPLSMMLLTRNATVTVCHTRTRDVAEETRDAELVVSAAGVLGSLTKDFVRPGQVVIDVSINWDPARREGKGGIAGDAVFDEVEPVVEAITPVPGGVGAVTTSVLLAHVTEACRKKLNAEQKS